jgi:poly(3-hydroxyalkanoate) depolymerase
MMTARDDLQPMVEVRTLVVDGRRVRVGIRRGVEGGTPLLICNGVGANLELLEPFTAALAGVETIVFDVPGVGGSDTPALPYRLWGMAAFLKRVLLALGIDRPVDVMGVSWGGLLAQQFAFQYPQGCRRLVLAATTPGTLMVPGRLSALSRMISPRRYSDPAYLRRVGPSLYGGLLRRRPDLMHEHARHIAPPRGRGYFYQQLAAVGWTSLWWLRLLRQPTLVMAGRDDPLVPVINARILALTVRHSRLALIDDGHLFMLTRPLESATLVRAFLAPPPDSV